VLHEEVEEAGFVGADFGEGGRYVVGDEVGASTLAREGDRLLEPAKLD
jgi:hypothetical protein